MPYNLATFRCDVIGGITTSVISLPVALGYGIASGLGAAAGIWSAIAIGFFAAVFTGTKSQISGPTAPTAVTMAVILTGHSNNLAEAMTIVFLAGCIQVFLGISKIGQFVAYTPHVVISSFMTGIGIIVMSIQLPLMLGSEATTVGFLETIQSIPNFLSNIHTEAVFIAALTIAIGFLWPQRYSKIVPGPLVAITAGTALGLLFFKEAPIIGTIPNSLPSFHIPLLNPSFLVEALQPALVLALLSSVETLITSLIADSMTGSRHNPTKELFGQGIGNIVASLIGAIPGAGAAPGTVVNIKAGGLTPISGVVRSAVFLSLVLGLGQFVEPIPLAALGAVLFKAGWDLTDRQILCRLHHLQIEHRIVWLLVLALTLFSDLITAVAIGFIAGAIVQARRRGQHESNNVISVPILDSHFFGEKLLESDDPYSARVGMVTMKGSLTVASSHNLVSVLGYDIKEHEVVIFDFSETIHIDDSAAVVIGRLINVAENSNTACIVKGLNDEVRGTLESFNILAPLSEDRIVNSQEEARDIARQLLNPF